MIKNPRLLLFAISTILLFAAKGASGQISIVLKYPDSYQFVPDDLFNVTVVNSTSQTTTVYIKGTVSDNKANLLVDVTSNSFDIAPGTHVLSPSIIGISKVEYFNSTLQQLLTQTGQFPSASYVSCVHLVDLATNSDISTNCVENIVEVIEPPHLSSPSDQSVLDNPYPVFSWLPPTALRPNQVVTYRLNIVEIYENQSITDAISRNPSLFTNSDLQQNIFEYPYTESGFEEYKNYAWQITASLGSYVIGSSEVWQFSYKKSPNDSISQNTGRQRYILLKDKTEGGYYLAEGSLKFRINDELGTGIRKIEIFTSDNKNITPNNPALTRPFQDDRYILDLTSVNDIEEDEFFLLHVTTNAQVKYIIRFKYVAPQQY